MIRFTKEGLDNLQKEYQELIKQRPIAVLDLKKAREMGDLSENGYYKAARAKLSSIDRNLARFSSFLNKAQVVKKLNNNTADIGSFVSLSDGKNKLTYAIVGDMEADPKSGKISLLSPIGKAIYGKKAGDKITVPTPKGKILFKVLSIGTKK